MKPIPLFLLLAGVALAQVKPANPGFEQGELGSVPPGWFVPRAIAEAGAKLTGEGCRTGGQCAMITGGAYQGDIFGNLMQMIPATGYTLRQIRLRAAIRVAGEQTRAQMWLRLDREDNTSAFLENMNGNPVTSSEWKTYDIEASVPSDVSRVVFGFMLFGGGTAWVDDVSLDVLGEVLKESSEPPRPLASRGLVNLTAFARLYGYVRFFHPSDQAAQTDWETFAVEGVRKVEDCPSTAELAERLEKLFSPVAPTVRVFPTGKRLQPADGPKATHVVRYKHMGVGLTSATGAYNVYKSERIKEPASEPKPFETELVPGLTVSVPLALYTDSGGTLPHVPLPGAAKLYERSAEDRATRLAAVIIAWNVFQHFYPYFDVVNTDWRAELLKALGSAATDAGVPEFHKTLRRLVAALKDGHGRVGSPRRSPVLLPPVTMDWIEDQFIVALVREGAKGLKPGDRVLKIDGKPVAQAAAEARALISAATEQWMRWRLAAEELSACDAATQRMTLEVEPYAAPGTSKTVELACGSPKLKDPAFYPEPRPEKIADLEPGIVYVDLDRVDEAVWKGVVPRLEKASGIIFDMRGYPSRPGILSLAHLTGTSIRSAKWKVPQAGMPDRLDFRFDEDGWDVPPQKPYFKARRVFLTDGRAISYAETVMGIVEHFKLGEIVGGPTAGTNGNVNPFKVPGGFTISWTGMKVLKQDGSQHHGIGILPTVPVSRTRKGVAEGKDEVLLRGLEVVRRKE